MDDGAPRADPARALKQKYFFALPRPPKGAGALFFRGFLSMPLSPDAKAPNTVSSQDIAFDHYI
jgi:hypothetical protein